MYFISYSDESKAYKLYNPIRKKLIINRDVQFVEGEARHGTLDKTINIAANIPQEEDEDFTSTCTSNVTPPTPIQGQNICQRTPLSSIRKTPHSQENTPSNVQQTPYSIGTLIADPSSPQSKNSSDMSNPTLASLRRQKFKSLRDIYE